MSKPVILLDAGQLVGLSGTTDGDVLKWNAATSSWVAGAGGGTGTVTSVALSTASTGLTVSGGTSQTITGAGTFTLGGTLGAGYGGTGLGAPVSGDAGKVLTAKADGTYELTTNGAGTVTNIATGTGLTGGPITGTGTISLAALSANPAGTKGSATASAVVTVDAYGRTTALSDTPIQLTSTAAVTGLDTALSGKVPTTRTVNTTTGQLTGGGALSADLTLGLATLSPDPAGTKGSATASAVVTVDAYGRTTSLSDTPIQLASTAAVTGLDAALGTFALKTTTISAGTGLSGGGDLSANRTISMPNVGTPVAGYGSASKTVTLSTDAQGRVSSATEQNISGLAASVISSGQIATAQGGTGIDASGATNGELLVGQSTGSFALHAMSQDATMANDGKVTVQGLQTRSVSSVAPTAGQTLVWSTSGSGAWVPGSQASGGSGGGGVLYYMNAGTAVSGGNLPAGTYQLGRTAEGASHPITVTNVPTSWTRVGGFVSDAGDPSLTNIPAGIWDFNNWVSSTANANNMFYRLTFYAYDGSTNPESGPALGTSVAAYLYDPSQSTQYTTSFALAQTAFTGKRIYLKLEVQATTANKDVTFDFGNGEASHVHTTVPSVTGSGFVKVLNDVIVSTGQTVDLSSSTDVGTSVLGVANGGTGQSALTNHGLVVGQGLAAVASLVGTTMGDVVRWNGTDWTSAPLSTYAVTGLTGTTNQVNVSASVGSVTLSLPQNIASTSSPTFAGLTLSGLSNGLVRSTSGVLAGGATVALGSEVTGTLPVANGGTGATTLTGYVKGTGTAALTASATIPVADVSGAAPLASPTFTGTVTIPAGASISGYLTTASAASTYAPLASPTFAGTVTIGSLSGLLRATAGAIAGSATVTLGSEVTGTLPIGNGGTGVSSLTSNALLIGGSTVGALSGTASGQVATWNGTIWTATAPATSGTVTNVSSSTTLSGLTLSTATGMTTPAISLTGTLGVTSGGTGLTTVVSGRLLYASATDTLAAGTLSNLAWDAIVPGTNVSISATALVATGRTVTISGGPSSGAAGGATLVQGGASAGGNGNGGALTLRGGAKNGTGTAGALTIGDANTSAISIGASGITTTVVGTLAADTAAVDTNTTQVATTAFVIGQGYLKSATASSTYAPIASPTFTGVPAAPTATSGTNTTQLATTAFVTAAVSAGQYTLPVATASVLGGVKQGSGVAIDGTGVLSANVLSVAGRTGAVTLSVSDVSGAAPLASPTFSGTPSLPTGTTGFTQSANDSSTKLATTAYADTAASNAKGSPYDVAGEYVGKPTATTVLMRFISNRSWTLKRTLVQASCTAFPTGSNAVATISIAGSNLASGTITWTTTSLVTVGAFADTTITSGQAVVLTLTTADSASTFENPFFTLGGVVA